MALKHGIQDFQLAQSVGQLRVLRTRVWGRNGGVEAAEDLLESVVVAFAVAAGKIGVPAGFGLEQRRIFDRNLIAAIAVALPEFVGPLLVPRDRRLCAVDFDAEAVLASSRDLAGGDGSARALTGLSAHMPIHMKDDCAEVFSVYGRFNIVFRAFQ